jgi:septum formation protein
MFGSHIILASASPARRDLLEQAGFTVLVDPTGIEEIISDEDPCSTALTIARAKMSAYRSLRDEITLPVLTADTLIFHENQLLGKPRDRTDAHSMLTTLSSSTHRVISAAVLYFPETEKQVEFYDFADVTFTRLDPNTIDWYLSTGEWEHAAGAYRIQHRGISLISSIEGDYFSIIGLPLIKFFGIVRTRI